MQKAKILLVDDDRLILRTVGQGLRQAGYHVQEAASPEAALEAVGEESFDLAVLDIRMPEGSGIQLGRKLRESHDLPSVFLTAYSDEETVKLVVQEGALGYVVKPADTPQLIPAIELALARAREFKALLGNKEQLEFALDQKRKTSAAVGMLMERFGMTYEGAFENLRSLARNERRKIESLAEEMVGAANTFSIIGQRLKSQG
jgi:response regulator NasT